MFAAPTALQGDKTVTMETKPEIQSHGLHGK
jgi:hypothetical protein